MSTAAVPPPGRTERRSGRTGRRPGSTDTRGRILAEARAVFGERGYDGTTVREVAARARVDPALVHHYFGTKQRLFVAAMEIEVDFAAVVPAMLDGPPERLGERIAGFVFDLWETPAFKPLILGMVRSASTDPVAAAMLRELIVAGPFLAIARTIDREDAPMRATLIGSQLVGYAFARYIVGVEPLASAPREVFVAAVGPTIQRYLTGDIGSAS